MNFLRLLTKRAHQNITFSCYKERQNDCTLKLLGENEKEFKSSEQKQLSFVPIADSKVSSIQILFPTIVVYKNDKKRKYLPHKPFHCFSSLLWRIKLIHNSVMQLGWLLQKRWSLEAAGGGGGFKLPTPLPREEKKEKERSKHLRPFEGRVPQATTLPVTGQQPTWKNVPPTRSAVFVVKDKKKLIGVGCAWGVWRGAGTGNFDARPFSPVFLLIAFHVGSSPWSKNAFTQICSLQMCRKSINLRNKYGAKRVNAIFAKSFTPPMQIWHLSSLPHIYSSVFTFLQYICMERICANPLFSPSVGDETQLLPGKRSKLVLKILRILWTIRFRELFTGLPCTLKTFPR